MGKTDREDTEQTCRTAIQGSSRNSEKDGILYASTRIRKQPFYIQEERENADYNTKAQSNSQSVYKSYKKSHRR